MLDALLGLIAVAASFAWLLWETNGLRVRLLTGRDEPPTFAQYKAYNSLKKRKYYEVAIHHGSNAPEPTGLLYNVVFDPGITEPLCGWEWLDKHCADLVDWQPEVYLDLGGVHYTMTVKQPGILAEVMKVNKLTKRQRAMYATEAA